MIRKQSEIYLEESSKLPHRRTRGCKRYKPPTFHTVFEQAHCPVPVDNMSLFTRRWVTILYQTYFGFSSCRLLLLLPYHCPALLQHLPYLCSVFPSFQQGAQERSMTSPALTNAVVVEEHTCDRGRALTVVLDEDVAVPRRLRFFTPCWLSSTNTVISLLHRCYGRRGVLSY